MESKISTLKKIRLHEPLKEEDYFHTADGRTIRSLKEFVLVIEHLADEVFHHHVTDSKNDFARWVKHVVGDEKLAENLMRSFDRQGHQRIILRHIVKNHVV